MATDHVNASLNRILRSGEYVCRPQRQIFVEHTFTNAKGQVTRQVTKADLDSIAATGNHNAVATGDLAPIGLGHTYDDIQDEKGNVVRKFSEADQPKPIGYLHNYYVAQRSDGKWALYADEWIKKVLQDERGQPVDGIQYAESFPRRSAEYFPGKKWIDWLALLRRTPALNMGLDIYAYASLHPEKAFYRFGHDGAALAGAVDSRGKWRYAHEESMNEADDEPNSSPAGKPHSVAPQNPGASGSPAAPADDRPPLEPQSQATDPMADPIHREAAQRYMQHCTGMHHSQVKTLLHHNHAMYAAQLGLPGDKLAEHVPPPATAAPPGAAPPATPPVPNPPVGQHTPAPTPPSGPAAPPVGPSTPPEHQKHSPVGLSGDSSWQHPEHPKHNAPVAGPGVGPAFIPGEEHKRMSAVATDIDRRIFANEQEKMRYEHQQLQAAVAELQIDKARAVYERDLTPLYYQYQFDLSVEVARMAKYRYEKAACDEQIATIKACYRLRDNPPVGGFIDTGDAAPNGLPSRPRGEEQPEKVSREESEKAKRYALKHGVDFDEALVKIRGA